ncbi:MAG: hypothetical protein COW10_07115 [Candidatus Omnitrophica bacterium CG12_big_fil_rev_8_21_14_0_65_42_8]|nr:MAG: hypothetical protein COW10_07115 [Candidatus Omnitrophica bacterium CG12_big_fil_rev_8_21_14_0_65_42_8]
MNRDYLYFHFANLVLIIIGILSIQKTVGPVITAFLVLGSMGGFSFSWYIRNSRPLHIDTFIGMLSLASVVVVLSRLYETEISFENLLRIFSTALVWLSLFQTFGLKTQKSYSMVQFISAALLISSVSLALEKETVFVLYLTVFLFILIFAMRLDLVCEKQNRGSIIVGDREEVMGLWHQIKVGAIMFSIVIILSALAYPAVPRFNNLSLSWIPSALLGLPERVPLLKLLQFADRTIKDAKVKKEQLADDDTKTRETSGNKIKKKEPQDRKGEDAEKNKMKKEEPKEKKEEKTERFKARDFNKDINAFKIESLTIKTDKSELPLDQQASLAAEIKLADGSIIPATKLVDWKVTGTAKASIDKDGKITPKEEGRVQISATYMGAFSNDVNVKITQPVKPKEKKGFLFYIIILLLWLLVLALAVFSIRIFIRSQKLAEMFRNNPKEFIKELYATLCRGFKIYGMPKFDYMAYREFYNDLIAGGGRPLLINARPEPMRALTEGFLEARFSSHKISAEHSQRAIELFHEVKDVILEREERNIFWKHLLFRISVLDVSLVPGNRMAY